MRSGFFGLGRRAALVLILALALPLGAASARNDQYSAQDLKDLDRASAYLNSIRTMQGTFVQVASNGGAGRGKFWMRKPGRLRFEYDPPTELALVADGTVVAVVDKAIDSVSCYPLSATPLKLILSKRVDLAKEVDIVAIDRRDGTLIIVAEEDSGVATGRITLIFEEPDLKLRQWVILDAQGIETRVALSDVEEGIKISRSMFRVDDDDCQTDWND